MWHPIKALPGQEIWMRAWRALLPEMHSACLKHRGRACLTRGACACVQDVRLAQECVDARLTGFPAWTINGRTLSGEQTLDTLEAELAKAPAAAPALAGS